MKMSTAAATATTTLVVGLNPALQKRLVLPGPLVPGNVHRITQQVQTGIGDKGQDVAVALQCLQQSSDGSSSSSSSSTSNTRLLQFLGHGPEGNALLEQLAAHGIDNDSHCWTIRTASPLRTCTSLVGPDTTTELVEPSGVIDASEVDELWQRLLLQDATTTTTTGIAFMGSLPPACPTDIYAQIYTKMASAETLTLVDSLVGLPTLLQHVQDKPQHGPVVLKVNVAELCQLVGGINNDDDDDTDQVVVSNALQAFLEQYPQATTALYAVALTNGPAPAYVAILSDKKHGVFDLTKVPVPKLDSTTTTLYPIGAGDAVAAGTLAAWQVLEHFGGGNDNDDNDKTTTTTTLLTDNLTSLLQQRRDQTLSSPLFVTAFAFGLACGSASCLQQENSVLDPQNVADLFANVPLPQTVTSLSSSSSSPSS